jgi:uncharacterized membrane protein YphA (DoxX/SURF4 family)
VSLLTATDLAVHADRRASLVARVVGALFVPAGLVKFVAYGWELENFRRFGLVHAPVWVLVAGIIEVVGGVLLVRRLAVAPAAAVLAITMVVAIAVSGIAHGDVIPSLTVAPVLLAALLFVLRRAGGGATTADATTR